MNKEEINQYYERIEKLLNGANKETYGFVPEEIRQILNWYEDLEQENQKYKEVIDKLNKYLHTRAIKKCYNGKVYCGFDGLQAQVFEDILKEVEDANITN